jgi:hypothetical protein
MSRMVKRHALAAFISGTSGETRFPSGTLFIPGHGNPPGLRPAFDALLQADGITAQAIASSYAFKGLSLGSNVG